MDKMLKGRLSGGGIVTTGVGAGGRDVSDLTTVVALLISWRLYHEARIAYSSASLLRALSGDVSFLTTVLEYQYLLVQETV